MNDLSCSREKPCEPQLNDGERLYTSHLPNETSNNELRVSAPAATVARARVETRGGEHGRNKLVWVLVTDRARERLRLFEIGRFRFEPQKVRDVRERKSAFQCRLNDKRAILVSDAFFRPSQGRRKREKREETKSHTAIPPL